MQRKLPWILLFLFAVLAGCTGQRTLPYEPEPDLRGEALEIAPRSSSIVAGTWKQFAVNYRDFEGNWHRPEGARWNASQGVINDDGSFTAPEDPGPVVITCHWQNLATSTDIIVVPNDVPISLEIVPATLEVQAGTTFPLMLRVRSAGNYIIEPPSHWEAEKGRIEIISGFDAPSRAGRYDPQDFRTASDEWEFRAIYTAPRDVGPDQIKATLFTGEETQAAYEIVPGAPAYIVINPRRANVAPDTTQVFAAIPYDRWGNRIAGKVVWAANDGTIDQNGVYRAPLTGGNTIISALFGNVKETAQVNNAQLGDPIRIVIQPDTGTVQIGQAVAFSASGIDEYGNTVDLRSPEWSTNNGEINQFGMYFSNNAAIGPARIRCQQSGVVAEVFITVIY